MGNLDWLRELELLHPNRRGSRTAPHKAVLLLAVLDLADAGMLGSGFVEISDALVRAFEENWRRYVPSDSPYRCSIHHPFFHMRYCRWWKLVANIGAGEEISEVSSLSSLKRKYLGARIAPGMLGAMLDADFRVRARLKLISDYLVGGGDPCSDPGGVDDSPRPAQKPRRAPDYPLPLFSEATEAAEPEAVGIAG